MGGAAMRRRGPRSKGPAGPVTGRGTRKTPARASDRTAFFSTGKGYAVAVLALASARLLSAAYNLIHDCDEVYNYWEPLHYFLYGEGFQTWEYRSVCGLTRRRPNRFPSSPFRTLSRVFC